MRRHDLTAQARGCTVSDDDQVVPSVTYAVRTGKRGDNVALMLAYIAVLFARLP